MTEFSVRNAYYLRVSASSVIPLYLYLDERHVDWMSDMILQHVLVDLQPLILPKLQAERDIHFGPGASSGKKGTVDVHRGETYQFAFFFQKTEPHSVIIKARSFFPTSVLAPNASMPPPHPGNSKNRAAKRKSNASENQGAEAASGRKRRKTNGTHRPPNDEEEEDDDDDVISISDDNETNEMEPPSRDVPATIRRPQVTARVPVRGHRKYDEDHVRITSPEECSGVEMVSPTDAALRDEVPAAATIDYNLHGMSDTTVKQEDGETALGTIAETTHDFDTVVVASDNQPLTELEEEDDKKHKLALKLKYQGFNIFGRCLCVVVEPWPAIQFSTRAPSVAPLTNEALRSSSIAPPDFVPSDNKQRGRTPLFLPDFDRARSQSSAPFPRARTLSPVPLFNDLAPEPDDNEYGTEDLMVFSQTLNAAGGMHVATADDDDEMDGAVLFGDADEVREFS